MTSFLHRPIVDALALHPGQAVHLGHSCILLDIAGLRILLDPATITGRATAPFANLTATARTRLETYQPLFDLPTIVPSAGDLARAADVVLYSHLHADHFNAALLDDLMAANPDLRVIVPNGARRLVQTPRPVCSPTLRSGLRALSRLRWLDTSPDGLIEYLTEPAPDLPQARLLEVADGAVAVLRELPRVVLRVFAVTHPSPLMWAPTPFEAAFPPVLGYEIGYDDHGQWRQAVLIGETALDACVLQRIWNNAATLTTAILPVDLPLGGPLLETWYAHTCHASPEFLALAARVAGSRTTIVPIHQGLWCYDFTSEDLPDWATRPGQTSRPPLPGAIADALADARAHPAFGPARLRAWRRLSTLLAATTAPATILDPLPGRPFRYDSGWTGRSAPTVVPAPGAGRTTPAAIPAL